MSLPIPTEKRVPVTLYVSTTTKTSFPLRYEFTELLAGVKSRNYPNTRMSVKEAKGFAELLKSRAKSLDVSNGDYRLHIETK